MLETQLQSLIAQHGLAALLKAASIHLNEEIEEVRELDGAAAAAKLEAIRSAVLSAAVAYELLCD